MVSNMKVYRVCVQSYLWNNSDYAEYDNYYTQAVDWNTAYEYAKKCIDNWNKESKSGVVYHIYDVTPHN